MFLNRLVWETKGIFEVLNHNIKLYKSRIKQ